jgi:hypothetical protein
MQPCLRRGSGSKGQAMKVLEKTLVEKIDEILLAFSNVVMKKQEYIRSIFWIKRLSCARLKALEKLF